MAAGRGLGLAMKLTELDTLTSAHGRGALTHAGSVAADAKQSPVERSRAGAEVGPDLDVDSIHVSRLPQKSSIEEPQAGAHVNWRAVRPALVVVLMAAFVSVLTDSGTTRSASGSHKPPIELTPAEQRAAAAAQARAAAIAKALHDRGTDAELQDTIPAATPPPTGTTTSASATASLTPTSAASH